MWNSSSRASVGGEAIDQVRSTDGSPSRAGTWNLRYCPALKPISRSRPMTSRTVSRAISVISTTVPV